MHRNKVECLRGSRLWGMRDSEVIRVLSIYKYRCGHLGRYGSLIFRHV